jgi:TPR repeat protein
MTALGVGATAARAEESLGALLARGQQGDAAAQSRLGWMYATGEGVAQDHDEAVRWLRKAASQGDIAAEINLAVSYAKGDGVAQDYAEAANWYRKAADQGNGAAQRNLGAMYAQGQGVPQDFVLAYVWFDIAAKTLSGTDGEAVAKQRDLAASRLTPEELLRATQMVQAWRPSTPVTK